MAYRTSYTLMATVDGTVDSELHAIPMTVACARIGHMFDLWQHNPVKLLRILEDARLRMKRYKFQRKCHPLRGLFAPVPASEEEGDNDDRTTMAPHEMSRDRRHTQGFNEGDFDFHVGDSVKVLKSAEEKYEFPDVNGEPDHDDERQWYYAKVIEIRETGKDREFDIEFEGGLMATKQRHEIQRRFISGELPPNSSDGAHFVLTEGGCSEEISGRAYLLLAFLVIVVLVAPEIIMNYSGSDQCGHDSESKEMRQVCQVMETYHLHLGVSAGLGLKLGVTSFICILLTSLLVPVGYNIAWRCSSSMARKMRKLMLNTLLDPIQISLLPNIYGRLEIVLVVLAVIAFASFMLMAFLLLSAGLVPFGFLVVRNSLVIINSLLGENAGMKEIRSRRIYDILLHHLRQTQIEMTDEDFRFELERFLSCPENAGTLQLSLPFLTLLASLFVTDEGISSCRIRKFLVKNAYAEFTHLPKCLARREKQYDVIVDVYDETVRVPGVDTRGERWARHCRIPWHLAIRREAIEALELQLIGEQMDSLFESKLKPGSACFSWRSPRNRLWHTQESINFKSSEKMVRDIEKFQKNVDASLNYLALDAQTIDEKAYRSSEQSKKFLADDLAQVLLRAGANPNFVQGHEKASSLYRACEAGHMNMARMLVEKNGDVNLKTTDGDTPLKVVLRSARDNLMKAEYKENHAMDTKIEVAIEGSNFSEVSLILLQVLEAFQFCLLVVPGKALSLSKDMESMKDEIVSLCPSKGSMTIDFKELAVASSKHIEKLKAMNKALVVELDSVV